MGEITVGDILERGIKLPDDRLSFPVEEFERYKSHLVGKGGVYVFSDNLEDIIYVGIAKNLDLRLMCHIKGNSSSNKKLHDILTTCSGITLTTYREPNQSLREFYENYLILKHNPECNTKKKGMRNEGFQISDDKYPIEKQKEVLRLYREGKSRKHIESLTGMNRVIQNMILKANDEPMNRLSSGLTEDETSERNAEILKYHKDGLTGVQISEILNIGTSTVGSVIRRHWKENKIKTPREIVRDRNDAIVTLYLKGGKTQRQVADEMGINQCVVQWAIRKYKGGEI